MTLPETGLNELFGIADENLRAIEEAFGVRLAARGNEIQVVGEGAAEDAARRDEVVARLEQSQGECRDRGHARRGRHAGLSALEGREPALEHRDRGIGEARVDVARLFVGEAPRGFRGASSDRLCSGLHLCASLLLSH